MDFVPVWKRLIKQDIQVGAHTLSNFITTNDPYVTPVPDERLAAVGSSSLKETITATQTDIPVASPDFFSNTTNNHLRRFESARN